MKTKIVNKNLSSYRHIITPKSNSKAGKLADDQPAGKRLFCVKSSEHRKKSTRSIPVHDAKKNIEVIYPGAEQSSVVAAQLNKQ